MKNLIFLLMTIFSMAAMAFEPVEKSQIQNLGVLENPGFEIGKTKWTGVGGTFSIVNSGTNLLFGKQSGTFTASATGQYIESALYTVPNGLVNTSCLAKVEYLGGSSNLKLQVLDGTSAVINSAELVLSAATTRSTAELGFKCPSSGSFKVRLVSTGASALIAVDNAYLGLDYRLFPASKQARVAAVVRYIGSNNCSFGSGVTNLTTDLSVNGGTCTSVVPVIAYQAIGTCSTTPTGNLKFTCTGMPAGTYTVVYEGSATMNVSNVLGFVGVYDGITTPIGLQINAANGAVAGTTVSSTFTYTTDGSRTWQLTANGSGNSAIFYYRSASEEGKFTIYYSPPVSADPFIQAAAPNDISVVNEFTAKISSSGVVSNENVDWISGNCTHTTGTNVCTFNSSVFAGTPNCTATTIAVPPSNWSTNTYSASTTGVSTSTYTLGASPTLTDVDMILQCNRGSTDFKVKTAILGYLGNTLYSGSTSQERVERARVNYGSCNITSQSGSWLSSVSGCSGGAITLNFAAPFTVTPTCFCTNEGSSSRSCSINSLSTTSVTFFQFISQSGAADVGPLSVICMGPK